MTELVPSEDIEAIVGAGRHPHLHLGIANTEDGQFYILHSMECKDTEPDLRNCEFSQALDTRGVDFWMVDTPLVLFIDMISGQIFTEDYEDFDE